MGRNALNQPNINRNEQVRYLSMLMKHFDIRCTKPDLLAIFDTFVDIMIEEVVRNGKAWQLGKFGKIHTRVQKSKKLKSPYLNNGEIYIQPEYTRLVFTPFPTKRDIKKVIIEDGI